MPKPKAAVRELLKQDEADVKVKADDASIWASVRGSEAIARQKRGVAEVKDILPFFFVKLPWPASCRSRVFVTHYEVFVMCPVLYT
jgi:hypothetical protein